jgi:hypothetical protein
VYTHTRPTHSVASARYSYTQAVQRERRHSFLDHTATDPLPTHVESSKPPPKSSPRPTASQNRKRQHSFHIHTQTDTSNSVRHPSPPSFTPREACNQIDGFINRTRGVEWKMSTIFASLPIQPPLSLRPWTCIRKESEMNHSTTFFNSATTKWMTIIEFSFILEMMGK